MSNLSGFPCDSQHGQLQFGRQYNEPPIKRFRAENSAFTEVPTRSQWLSHQINHYDQPTNPTPKLETLDAQAKSLADKNHQLEQRIIDLENKVLHLSAARDIFPPTEFFPNTPIADSMEYTPPATLPNAPSRQSDFIGAANPPCPQQRLAERGFKPTLLQPLVDSILTSTPPNQRLVERPFKPKERRFLPCAETRLLKSTFIPCPQQQLVWREFTPSPEQCLVEPTFQSPLQHPIEEPTDKPSPRHYLLRRSWTPPTSPQPHFEGRTDTPSPSPQLQKRSWTPSPQPHFEERTDTPSPSPQHYLERRSWTPSPQHHLEGHTDTPSPQHYLERRSWTPSPQHHLEGRTDTPSLPPYSVVNINESGYPSPSAIQPVSIFPLSRTQAFNLHSSVASDRQYPYDDPEFLQKYNDLNEEGGQFVTSTARNKAAKRKAEALEDQSRATVPVTLSPSYIPPRSEAEILQRQRRVDTALKVAKMALTAKILLNQLKISESLKFANQVLKIDPNFLLALKCKAEALRCLEKFAKSLKFANRILYFVPDDVIGLNCSFHASISLANRS